MNITVTLTEDEVKCLENDLLDIEEWVQNAVKEKVKNCKSRILEEWVPKLLQDPEVSTISGDENQLITQIITHKNYKNRALKEEESAKGDLGLI